MAEEVIFPGCVRQFDHIDIILADYSFNFGWRIRFIDDDEVLDGFIALIGDTFDCAQNAHSAICKEKRSMDHFAGIQGNTGITSDINPSSTLSAIPDCRPNGSRHFTGRIEPSRCSIHWLEISINSVRPELRQGVIVF
jgi:hypothetical protein